MIQSLGIQGPFGDASIRQVCKDQNVHESVLLSVLEVGLFDAFEMTETLPAYGLLQLCELIKSMMSHIGLQLNRYAAASPTAMNELQSQWRLHAKELEETFFPHITSIYELYYSPEYTAGKNNLLSYSVEFFPKNTMPLALLKNFERNLELEQPGNWSLLLDFNALLELALSVERMEERMIKPLVLSMEEGIITTFQKTKNKPQRLAYLNLPESVPDGPLLSKRELEVLSLVAQGFMNKEIADRLTISLTTVITHRKNLTSKLGIHTLAGLTVYAFTHGFLNDVILTNED